MSSRNSRVTGAIVVILSLIAVVVFAVPWVDEYLRLRNDAAELTELESKFAELRKRNEQLDRIDQKLTNNLQDLNSRSIDSMNVESVREAIVEIVRQAGGRIRRLEIANGERRTWAIDGDMAENGTMPIYGEESNFELHTHTVELQVDGSLESIQTIMRRIFDTGWLMTTKGLTMRPTPIRESPVNLELRLVLYGLTPRTKEEQEEFALRPIRNRIR